MQNIFRSLPALALAAAIFPATLAAQAPAAQLPLEIVGAYYGFGNNFADVTAQVRSQVRGDDLNMPVNAGVFGLDAVRGGDRVLRIYYRRNGQFYHREWREGAMAQIGLGKARGKEAFAPAPTALHVTFAVYGMGAQTMDVTGLMQSRITSDRLDVPINNASLGGDPAPQVPKQFRINYEYGGVPYEITLNENDVLHLPDAGMAAGAGVIGSVPLTNAPVAAIRIVRAEYGSGPRQADVTGFMQVLVNNGTNGLIVNNTSLGGGDPAPGEPKTLHVTYEVNGQRMEKRAGEGQQLMLP
jgi:hypothetical protein